LITALLGYIKNFEKLVIDFNNNIIRSKSNQSNRNNCVKLGIFYFF